MHPRYFIGLTLPSSLHEKITAIQAELFQNHTVMEPLVPHITLLHPNILMTLSPLYIMPKVKVLAAEHLPVRIELTRTAMFGSRVLHIAVRSPELVDIQKKLVELLPDDVRARYEVGREFTPHVTLAQAKPMQKLNEELVEKFKSKIDPLLPQHFEAKNLNRFTWLGPRSYEVKSI